MREFKTSQDGKLPFRLVFFIVSFRFDGLTKGRSVGLAVWLAELGLRFLADVHVYEMLSGLELSPDRLALLLLHLLGRWQNGRRCQSCLIVATTSGGGVGDGDGAVLGATDWLHSQC